MIAMPIIPREGSRLSWRLANVFNTAARNVGQTQATELKNGLLIEVIYNLDGCIGLQISRERIYPSDTEWKTVVEHLPFVGVDPGEPKHFEHGRRYYMRAYWPWDGGCGA